MASNTLFPRAAARALLLAALATAAAGCDEDGIFAPIEDEAPNLFLAEYAWVFESFRGDEPVGQHAVHLAWEPGRDWGGEPFRVYARRSGGGRYVLAATVTSCSDDVCRYTDLDVAGGRSYDYYVVAVDERSGREFTTSDLVTVDVPELAPPGAPTAVRATALDGAVYLSWNGSGATRYSVYLEQGEELFIVGETDGTGFVDERAENGVTYRYRLAAVGEGGQVSGLSAPVAAIPRPDYHSEVIRAFAADPARSGFRFVEREVDDPIVAGTADAAQWRLETVDGVLSLRPLGDTRITAGQFTTALACGPGSEADCVAVERAPAASAFGAAPVPADPGYTYVLRVTAGDGRVHFGKVRVQGAATDASGAPAAVFDWAYQTVPDEPALWRNAKCEAQDCTLQHTAPATDSR